MGDRNEGKGQEGFELHYLALYRERWSSLRAALEGPGEAVGLRLLGEGGGYRLEDPATEGLYRLDAASVFAAESLVMPDSGLVLDACAAPGGKTLVLAARSSPGVRLFANELSAERRRRLKIVLDERLPVETRERVKIGSFEAAAMCRGREGMFGAILLDAPCSSERHVLASPSALAQWSAARIRNLAHRQWALLSSAFIMLKPGGCMVYSTCSISPEENDAVVSRLSKKWGTGVRYDGPHADSWIKGGAEKTERGLLLLPDRTGGAGPIFVARIFKPE
jgi:16S rRNA C967 or C1407 C5-methylase (RsmB/RsmF family)